MLATQGAVNVRKFKTKEKGLDKRGRVLDIGTQSRQTSQRNDIETIRVCFAAKPTGVDLISNLHRWDKIRGWPIEEKHRAR